MGTRILLITTVTILYFANVQAIPLQNELAPPFDCKGKDFYCINSRQYVNCFDVNHNGQTQTVNDEVLQCAGPLFCDNAQPFECFSETEPPATTTQPPPAENTETTASIFPTETSTTSGTTAQITDVTSEIPSETVTPGPIDPTQPPVDATNAPSPIDQNQCSTNAPPSPESPSKPMDMECVTAGIFPHIYDCSKYYRCVKILALGMFKYDFTCPPKYFFDATSEKCILSSACPNICQL